MKASIKKQLLIVVLILLFVLFLSLFNGLIEMFFTYQQEGEAPNDNYLEQITAIASLGFVIGGMVLAGISLKRLEPELERERESNFSSKPVSFAPLKKPLRLNQTISESYFLQVTPRAVDEKIFKAIWSVIMPLPLIILIWVIIVPMTFVMLLTFQFFVAGLNEAADRLDREPTAIVDGVVETVEVMHGKAKGWFQVNYRFYAVKHDDPPVTPDDNYLFQGFSFSDEDLFKKGDRVEVEYLISSPRISRVNGLKMHPMNLDVLIGGFYFITLLLPVFLILFLYWRKKTTRRLVCEGIYTDALLLGVKKRGRKIVMAQVTYERDGVELGGKLVAPIFPKVFEVLKAREESQTPVKVLVYSKSAYLIEPHFVS